MKPLSMNWKTRVLCGFCVVLLLSSCKLIDSVREKANSVFNRGSDAVEGTQAVADENPVADDSLDTQNAEGGSEETEEESTQPRPPAWEPPLEPILTQSLTLGQPQEIVVEGGMTLSFPAGAFTETPPDLIVSNVTGEIPTPFEFFDIVEAYDVSLGELHTLAEPLTVTLSYGAAPLNADLSAESQLGVLLYDKLTDSWVVLDSVIDEANQTLTFQTDHLSVVGVFLRTDTDSSCQTTHFKINYNRAKLTVATLGMVYTSTMNSCSAANDPIFIQAVADYLEIAYQNYSFSGFQFPQTQGLINVDVADLSGSNLWASDSQFDTLTGDLIIGTNSMNSPDNLRQDCAHELFHYWQYHNIGISKYLQNQYWMEATADYAADKVAYASSSYVRTNSMGQSIKSRFLQDSITSTENLHAYSLSHFVDYLINKSGGYSTLADLWSETTRTYSAVENLKLSVKTRLYSVYPDVYRDFANYMLFDSTSPLPLGVTVWKSKAVNNEDKVVYTIDMGEKNAQIDVKPYASGLFGLRVTESQFMTLEWTNPSDGVIYVFFDEDQDQRTGNRAYYQLFANQKAVFPMKPESTVYVLMINPNSEPLQFDLTYGYSDTQMYTLGLQYGGDDSCVQNSAWGTPRMFMDIKNNVVSIHYSSEKNDYYWNSESEHTMTATGDGLVNEGTLTASLQTQDTIANYGLNSANQPLSGSVSANAKLELTPRDEFRFYWDGTATGSSSVDLPASPSRPAYACTGSVTGVSVYPAYYFPLAR